MTTEVQRIIEKLNSISSDLDFIKKHVVDVDLVLTEEDLDSLDKAENDFKQGKTKRI